MSIGNERNGFDCANGREPRRLIEYGGANESLLKWRVKAVQQQPMRQVSPDQLVQALMPIVTEANRVFDAGASMQSVLREAALAGFLMGRGATPAQAMETVLQWRMSGMAPALARQMRSDAGGAVRTLPAPAGAPGADMSPGTAAETARTLPMPVGGGTPLTPRDRETLGAQVQKFMQDQANAGLMYRELVAQTPGEDLKAYVQHALDDEQEHYRMLAQFHRELTGRTYDVQPQPTAFENLRAGLKMAMDGEYEAFEGYRSIYLRYHDPQIRDIFFRLMTDELEHATRFNYVLQALPAEG
jgi:rubrerythrin